MIDPNAFYAKKNLAEQIAMDAGPFYAAYDDGRLKATPVGRSLGFHGWELIEVLRELPKVSGPEMRERYASCHTTTPQGAKG